MRWGGALLALILALGAAVYRELLNPVPRAEIPNPAARACANRIISRYQIYDMEFMIAALDEELPRIRALPLDDRIDIFTAIVARCRMESGVAEIFADDIGNDYPALLASLKRLRESPRYSQAALEQRREIDEWIEELSRWQGPWQ